MIFLSLVSILPSVPAVVRRQYSDIFISNGSTSLRRLWRGSDCCSTDVKFEFGSTIPALLPRKIFNGNILHRRRGRFCYRVIVLMTYNQILANMTLFYSHELAGIRLRPMKTLLQRLYHGSAVVTAVVEPWFTSLSQLWPQHFWLYGNQSLYIFMRNIRLSGGRAFIAMVHIRQFYKVFQNYRAIQLLFRKRSFTQLICCCNVSA